MLMDGWTGGHGEAIVALCSFANMPVRLAYSDVYTLHYFLSVEFFFFGGGVNQD
jgi:hypothetical protein